MEDANKSAIIEGVIADYKFDSDGILISYSKPIARTVDNITANMLLVKKITRNKKVPLLIYITPSPVPDKATRKFSTEQLPNVYTAMAMVGKPGVANMIMRILFKLKSPPIPIKLFSSETEARIWLKQFIE